MKTAHWVDRSYKGVYLFVSESGEVLAEISQMYDSTYYWDHKRFIDLKSAKAAVEESFS